MGCEKVMVNILGKMEHITQENGKATSRMAMEHTFFQKEVKL